jgi:hypothetical protein
VPQVRAIIAASAPGALKHMSAALMVDELVQSATGISEHAAKGLYSQIRRHAPLHAEWHAAFTDGRFKQVSGKAAWQSSVAKQPPPPP